MGPPDPPVDPPMAPEPGSHGTPSPPSVAEAVVSARDRLATERGEGFMRVLKLGTVTAALTMMLDAFVFLQTDDTAYLIFAMLAALALVAVVYGSIAVQAGHVDQAVAVPLLYILVVAPIGPALVPSRALVSVVLPVIAMAVAMNYAAARWLRHYGVASWLSGTSVLALWQYGMVRDIGIDVGYAVTNVVTASIIMAFSFYALSHYSRRLQSAFDDVKGSASELAAAHDALRQVDAARIRFMNNAAHELKTPITPISIQLHLIKRSEIMKDERAKHSIDILDRNFVRLQRLVSDILDGARMDAGKLEMRLVPVALSDTLTEAVEEYERAAELSGIRLERRIDGDLHVLADPLRIRQVVDNLLSNALKFTDPGGKVAIDAFSAGGEVCVNVRDTGMGVAPQDLARLFKPFVQVHDPMKTVTGGSGLGLFIAKGIVERHNGRIHADSEGQGKGATFSFILPQLPHVFRVDAPPRRATPAPPFGTARLTSWDDPPA